MTFSQKIRSIFSSAPFFLTGIYLLLTCFIVVGEFGKKFLFEGRFKEHLLNNIVDVYILGQKNALNRYFLYPLELMKRVQWSIGTGKFGDTTTLLPIMSAMNTVLSVEKINILLDGEKALEIARVRKKEVQPFRYICLSQEKQIEKGLYQFSKTLYSTSGKYYTLQSFHVPEKEYNLQTSNSFLQFASYDALEGFHWFKELKQQKQPLWIGPEGKKDIFLSLVLPLIDPYNAFSGMVFMRLPLDNLLAILDTFSQKDASDKVCMFHQRGEIIALSPKDQLYSWKKGVKTIATMKTLEDPEVSYFYERYNHEGQPKKIFGKGTYGNKIAYFYQLPKELHAQWTVMNITSQEKILYSHEGSNHLFIVITLVIAVAFITIILIFMLMRYLIYPMQSLALQFQHLSNFKMMSLPEFPVQFKEIQAMVSAGREIYRGMETFYRLLPLSIATFFVKRKKEVDVYAERVDVTLLFCDMAGFTHLAEYMPPEDLVSYLSLYFQSFTDHIHWAKGDVNQYIGDAILAIWGAPAPLEHQSYWACRCALRCLHTLQGSLNETLRLHVLPELYVSFGLSCGQVLAGPLGSFDRMQYTVIGERAFLAEALQGLNRYYGTHIMVHEELYHQVKEYFLMRPVDRVRLQEKSWMLYELLGEYQEIPEEIHQLALSQQNPLERTTKGDSKEGFHTPSWEVLCHLTVLIEKAWAFYEKKDWKGAKEAYGLCLKTYPKDRLAKAMYGRCEAFLIDPPDQDWEGAYDFSLKS